MVIRGEQKKKAGNALGNPRIVSVCKGSCCCGPQKGHRACLTTATAEGRRAEQNNIRTARRLPRG